MKKATKAGMKQATKARMKKCVKKNTSTMKKAAAKAAPPVACGPKKQMTPAQKAVHPAFGLQPIYKKSGDGGYVTRETLVREKKQKLQFQRHQEPAERNGRNFFQFLVFLLLRYLPLLEDESIQHDSHENAHLLEEEM